MRSKKLGIIGYGNVGKTLENNLKDNFDIIIKKYNDSYSKLSHCKIIIISVQDKNLKKVIEDLRREDYLSSTVFHTSGSVGIEIFGKDFKNYGCFHFPMSIRRENIVSLKKRYVLFQGNRYAKAVFNEIFHGFDLRTFTLDPESIEMYHYACSIFSNIPFYFLRLGMEHLKELNLPSAIGLQLFETAYDNFTKFNLLTGPIIRKDDVTIKKHINSIKNKDEQKLYTELMAFFNNILNEREN